MSGLAAVMKGIAASLDPLADTVEGLQVTWFQNDNPTPPSIDMYPAGLSAQPAAQGVWEEMIVVRARVGTPDDVGGQEVLCSLMDTWGPSSVIAALEFDPTFGNTVESSIVETRTGYQPFPSPAGTWLGCEWSVRTMQ